MYRVWLPLADNEVAASALATVNQLEADLIRGLGKSPSLSDGDGGIALFFAYRCLQMEASTGRADRTSLYRALQELINALEAKPMDISLYSGFLGPSWVLAHTERLFGLEWLDLAEVDEVVLRAVNDAGDGADFDLINGAIGCGLYALERFPSRFGVECIYSIIQLIDRLKVDTPAGPVWRSTPERTGDPMRYPDGFIDCGVAHGVAGIVAFLATASKLPLPPNQSRELLARSTEWLLSQRARSDSGVTRFPAQIVMGEPMPGRPGWCHGNLGIALALLASSDALNDRGLRDIGVHVALQEASGTVSEVDDPSLCHGSAGFMHLFNRLYQQLREPRMKSEAIRWLGSTLAHASKSSRMGSQGALRKDVGFIEGASGVGLSLLAATGSIDPAWDALLLASDPMGSSLR